MYGLQDRYDFAFSMGAACACSQALRRAGMQYASFPFDWANTREMAMRTQILLDSFADLMPLEDLEYVGPNPSNDKDIYINRKTGMTFLHDFPKGKPIAECIEAIREKYRRRAARLHGLLERGGSVLMLFLGIPNRDPIPDGEFIEARRRIAEKYPCADFDFLVISQKNDLAFTPSLVRKVAEGVFRADFDYRIDKPGSENIGNEKIVASVLKRLIKGVRDYRTEDERRRYREVKRKQGFELYRASTHWELIRNRFYYKLMRHFQHRLERKGFVFQSCG